MQLTFGTANGGHPASPRAAHTLTYPVGPFSVTMGPTLFHKQSGETLYELWAGLLMTGPDPDGNGGVEYAGPDYERQPATIKGYSTDYDMVVNELEFYLTEGVDVQYLGLFDDQGRLRFYGRLIWRQMSYQMQSYFAFQATAVKVKRFKPVPTEIRRPQIGGAPRNWTKAGYNHWTSEEV